MKHGARRELFVDCPASTLVLQQIAWLKEQGAGGAHLEPANDNEEDELDDAKGVHEAIEPVEKRRGQPRRVRRTLKYKFRAIALLERVKEELETAAD
jgi:hypothetical protein